MLCFRVAFLTQIPHVNALSDPKPGQDEWGQLREHPESISQALTAHPLWGQPVPGHRGQPSTTSGLSPQGFRALAAQEWGLPGTDLGKIQNPSLEESAL